MQRWKFAILAGHMQAAVHEHLEIYTGNDEEKDTVVCRGLGRNPNRAGVAQATTINLSRWLV
jgi:hypothetical protein